MKLNWTQTVVLLAVLAAAIVALTGCSTLEDKACAFARSYCPVAE